MQQEDPKEHFLLLFWGGREGELHYAKGGLRNRTGSGSVPQLDNVIIETMSPLGPFGLLTGQILACGSPRARK